MLTRKKPAGEPADSEIARQGDDETMDTMDMKERALDLRRKMFSVGVTETELAPLVGVSAPMVCYLMNGRRRLSEARMDALHAAFLEVAKAKIERLQEVVAEPRIRGL
jgi:predicted transcriptional regulator